MQSFTSLLSIFGLFIALIQTSVLAAPIALSKNIEQVGKRTLVPAGGSDYSPTSASDSELVLQCLTEKGASYADPEKLVFYTSPNDGTGYEMAENFVRANPSYKNFWDLYGEDFESDFGISAEDVPYEAAEAMAQYASQVTRVFGASDGTCACLSL
jgi:hypothetical protein